MSNKPKSPVEEAAKHYALFGRNIDPSVDIKYLNQTSLSWDNQGNPYRVDNIFEAGAKWLAGELMKGPIGPKVCMKCNEQPAKICGQCHTCCPCNMLPNGVAGHLKTLMGDI